MWGLQLVKPVAWDFLHFFACFLHAFCEVCIFQTFSLGDGRCVGKVLRTFQSWSMIAAARPSRRWLMTRCWRAWQSACRWECGKKCSYEKGAEMITVPRVLSFVWCAFFRTLDLPIFSEKGPGFLVHEMGTGGRAPTRNLRDQLRWRWQRGRRDKGG